VTIRTPEVAALGEYHSADHAGIINQGKFLKPADYHLIPP